MSEQKPNIIYLAFANTHDDLEFLTEESSGLLDELRPLEDDHNVKIHIEPAATRERLFEDFNKYRNRILIFHYAGHALPDKLLLFGDNPEGEFVNSEGLTKLLIHQKALQLIFLNGCSTEQQVDGFLKAGAKTIIATLDTIPDPDATLIAKSFYQSLFSGASIDDAFESSRGVVLSKEDREENIRKTRQIFEGDTLTNDVLFPWQLYENEKAIGSKNDRLTEILKDPLLGLSISSDIGWPNDPYKGLLRFERDDARIFFGRKRMTRRIYDWLISDEPSNQLLLLHGASGSGKSSFLESGLIPYIENDFNVAIQRRDECKNLLQCFNQAIDKLKEVEKKSASKPALIIIDQAEHGFSKKNKGRKELKDLCAQIKKEIRREQTASFRLIISFRKDWYSEFRSIIHSHEIRFDDEYLDVIDEQGIVDVITGPAIVKSIKIEDESLEFIKAKFISDTDSPITPVLQLVLKKMWEQVVNDTIKVFDIDLYKTVVSGGKEQPDSVYDQLPKQSDLLDQQFDLLNNIPALAGCSQNGLILDVLYSHVISESPTNQEELEKDYGKGDKYVKVKRIIVEAKGLHVLVTSRSDYASSRIAHDILVPFVLDKFKLSNKPGQIARRLLEMKFSYSAMSKTDLLTKRESKFLNPKALSGMRNLTNHESELVSQSTNSRRLKYIRYFSIIVIVGIVIFYPVKQTKEKIWSELLLARLEERANSEFIKARNTHSMHHYARLVAEKSKQKLDPRLARIASENILRRFESDDKLDENTIIAISNKKLAATIDGKDLKLWSFDAKSEFRKLYSISFSSTIEGVKISEDERFLIAWQSDGEIQILNLNISENQFIFKDTIPTDSVIDELIISPDNKYFVVWFNNGKVRLYYLDNKSSVDLFAGNKLGFTARISESGRYIFYLSTYNLLSVYDIEERKQKIVGIHDTLISGYLFHEEKHALISWDLEGNVLFNHIKKQLPIADPIKLDSTIYSGSFSEEKKLLLLAITDKILIYNLDNYKEMYEPIEHKNTETRQWTNEFVRLRRPPESDGMFNLQTGELHRDIASKKTTDPTKFYLLEKSAAEFTSTKFTPNESKIISWSSSNQTVKITDIESKLKEQKIIKINSKIIGANLSADESILVTWDKSGDIKLWDPNTGYQVGPALIHGDGLKFVRLYENPTYILSWSDTILKKWDIEPENNISNSHWPCYVKYLSGTQLNTHGDVEFLQKSYWKKLKKAFESNSNTLLEEHCDD